MNMPSGLTAKLIAASMFTVLLWVITRGDSPRAENLPQEINYQIDLSFLSRMTDGDSARFQYIPDAEGRGPTLGWEQGVDESKNIPTFAPLEVRPVNGERMSLSFAVERVVQLKASYFAAFAIETEKSVLRPVLIMKLSDPAEVGRKTLSSKASGKAVEWRIHPDDGANGSGGPSGDTNTGTVHTGSDDTGSDDTGSEGNDGSNETGDRSPVDSFTLTLLHEPTFNTSLLTGRLGLQPSHASLFGTQGPPRFHHFDLQSLRVSPESVRAIGGYRFARHDLSDLMGHMTIDYTFFFRGVLGTAIDLGGLTPSNIAAAILIEGSKLGFEAVTDVPIILGPSDVLISGYHKTAIRGMNLGYASRVQTEFNDQIKRLQAARNANEFVDGLRYDVMKVQEAWELNHRLDRIQSPFLPLDGSPCLLC